MNRGIRTIFSKTQSSPHLAYPVRALSISDSLKHETITVNSCTIFICDMKDSHQ